MQNISGTLNRTEPCLRSLNFFSSGSTEPLNSVGSTQQAAKMECSFLTSKWVGEPGLAGMLTCVTKLGSGAMLSHGATHASHAYIKRY